MRVLISGGSAKIRIDKFRVISSISDREMAIKVADEAIFGGHDVTLIGNREICFSRPEMRTREYETLDELEKSMFEAISTGSYDCVVHFASTSEHDLSRVLIPESQDERPKLVPLEPCERELPDSDRFYLEMTPKNKMLNDIRSWGFEGILVGFELYSDLKDEDLVENARKSLRSSKSDVILASCIEWESKKFYLISEGAQLRAPKTSVPSVLMDMLERGLV